MSKVKPSKENVVEIIGPDVDKIQKAMNEINRQLISEDYISLTESYSELGLSPTEEGVICTQLLEKVAEALSKE